MDIEVDQEDTIMADTSLASSIGAATSSKGGKESKSRELFSCTISHPTFAYAHVEVVTPQSQKQKLSGDASSISGLDALQIRSYCDAALKQFLGVTGAGMPLDLLKIDGNQFWLRLPCEDLGLFAASIAAWSATRDGAPTMLRLLASGNWLGSLLGRQEQNSVWQAKNTT